MPFVFTVEGEKVSSDDLTLDEVIAVEKATGSGWFELNPYNSAAHCRAILVQINSRRRPKDDAEKLVGAMTIREAQDSVDFVARDDRPEIYQDGIPVVDPKAERGEQAMT